MEQQPGIIRPQQHVERHQRATKDNLLRLQVVDKNKALAIPELTIKGSSGKAVPTQQTVPTKFEAEHYSALTHKTSRIFITCPPDSNPPTTGI
jgi:hypothetical protein